MKDSIFKLFSSVQLVQEVSQSTTTSTSRSSSPTSSPPHGLLFTDHLMPIHTMPQQPSPSSYIDYHHQYSPYDDGATAKPKSSSTPPYPGTRRAFAKHPPPQQQQYTNEHKSVKKSQKLLCLWPLPVLTRCTILLSILLSALNGWLRVSCTSPKLVLFRGDILGLLLSPFLFDFTLQGTLLFGWNILILGLFESSLSPPLGGSRSFTRIMAILVVAVCALRQLLGFLFSRATGWALPSLFFSDAMHECNQGLAPFLFALLILQSTNLDDKYILIFGHDEDSKRTIRKVYLQLLMLLVNYTVKNILWWSLTGLIIGYLATLLIQMTFMVRLDDEGGFVTDQEKASLLHPTPIWRVLWSAVKRCLLVLLMTLPVLVIFNAYYTLEDLVDSSTLADLLLNNNNSNDHLFSFVIMTAPRRGDPPFLSETLSSYLDAWADDKQRQQLFVYTHFSNHSEYDRAHDRFHQHQDVKWVREAGDVWDHRLHLSSALTHALNNGRSAYVALLEDDFPICGRRAWREIETVVYKATLQVPGHCGVFVGTGGSGLLLKPEVAELVARLLMQYTSMPPDIVIQNCLRGDLPECHFCSQSLVVSKTLLMHHIGFNASTSDDRKYKKNEFQCGWRHPFNGDPDVITM